MGLLNQIFPNKEIDTPEKLQEEYQKMFLLAPEGRQVTPYTIMAGNYLGLISPWYRQYLNLGY